MICSKCGGSGSAEHVICRMCRGTGEVDAPCLDCGEPAVETIDGEPVCATCADKRRNLTEDGDGERTV